MKALPKKRKYPIALTSLIDISKISMLKWQALWYSSCIAAYIWFMYWIAYDFFVWYTPISEVNPANYAGAITTIALIWAGTKILKPKQFKLASSQQMLVAQKPELQSETQQKHQKAAPANAECLRYFGYLSRRQKKQEIPAKCLTCRHVIECMNRTN